MKKSYRKFKTVSDLDLRYLAGILDGASCFFIGTQPAKNYSKGFLWKGMIKVCSCDQSLILFLRNMLFEGSAIYNRVIKEGDRKVHQLYIDGEILDDLLPRLIDVLVVKKKHAQTLLQFRNSIGESDEYLESLRQEMKRLNSFQYKKEGHVDLRHAPQPQEG